MTIEDKLKCYESLKSEYQSYHTYMQVLHDHFFISSENINRSYNLGTELDYSQLWDATSINAVKVAVAGVHSYLTPPNSKWFDLTIGGRNEFASYAVRRWLSDVTDETNYILGRSNFDQQSDSFYASSFVYGTALMYCEEDIDDIVRFKTVPIKNVYMVEDAKERVVEFYIKHEYTVFQAVTEFGINNLSKEMVEEFNNNRHNPKKYEFLHYVGKRAYYDINKMDNKNMPWASEWYDCKNKKLVRESGYQENPFGVHRFYKRSNMVQGFSPCMDSLPFVRTLNTIVETNIIGAQTVVRPPLDVPDQGYITQFNLNPGALNIRRANVSKDNGIRPITTGARPDIGIEFQEMYKDIRQALFNDIFMAFADITKQMTIPEVRERVTEKMSMLGPAVGRYQTEYLQSIIERTVAIAYRNGRLPEPPREILENPEYKIKYVSPLALAQRAGELTALQNMVVAAQNLSQTFPTVLDKIDSDAVIDVIAQMTGAPMNTLNSDEKVADIRNQRAQQQQAQSQLVEADMMSDMVEKAGNTERNLAQAERARK
jgi:hypothetical protein